MTNSKIIPNRLINESSPYLLQHAHNPVDWFPWCEEAFVKAKTENKPIFLSIGYSTCHWCHVMEYESFENQQLADILNKGFVSIKVDKEERPDIDSIYMDICQLMTGSGGWPLSLFLDHEGNCFYAATYFPKLQFIDLLHLISETFQTNRSQLLEQSKKITSYLKQQPLIQNTSFESDICQMAYRELKQNFDDIFGGFSIAPKFPSPHNMLFLMEYFLVTKETAALNMAEKTLTSIYKGGIHDHIGGGYCRYSTDRQWLAPHFEKMLYDNALLAIAFSKCYEITKKELYQTASCQILDYVLRDMTDENGGFYSAEDADSEGEEGLFYLWTIDEIKKVLGENADAFCMAYDITKDGNFEGKNIPNLINNKNLNPEHNLDKLFKEREKRIHPFKDEKILVGWNGLMIAAFSICGRLLHQNKYIDAATNAVSFISKNLIDSNHNLLSVYKDGSAKNPAHLEDISFLAWGVLELHRSTLATKYLLQSIELCDDALENFFHHEVGGFYLTSNKHEKLIAKSKPFYDGAIPSPNSVIINVMKRIDFIMGESKYEQAIEKTKKCFHNSAASTPTAFTNYYLSELFEKTAPKKIILIGNGKELDEMVNFLEARLNYNDVIVVLNPKEQITKEKFHSYPMTNNKATAYICSHNTCYPPMNEIPEIEKVI